MMVPPGDGREPLALRAAGFMATSTGRVAGGEDVVVGDVDLEGRDPGQGAGRGPDLGREVGKVAVSLPNRALTVVNGRPSAASRRRSRRRSG
jgi:hypothetical protein